jgi:hypothetical protein
MTNLKLADASSAMSAQVGFVLAIPMLEPENHYTDPRPVVGIVYIDSNEPDFFIDDNHLTVVVAMMQRFLDNLANAPAETYGRVRNFPLSQERKTKSPPSRMPRSAAQTLDIVDHIRPPRSSGPFQFNFDYSDFVPTQIRSTI